MRSSEWKRETELKLVRLKPVNTSLPSLLLLHLLILSWPTFPKPHAKKVNSGLLARLTLLWTQAADIAGVVHLYIPKRDKAPCAAKTGTGELASP